MCDVHLKQHYYIWYHLRQGWAMCDPWTTCCLPGFTMQPAWLAETRMGQAGGEASSIGTCSLPTVPRLVTAGRAAPDSCKETSLARCLCCSHTQWWAWGGGGGDPENVPSAGESVAHKLKKKIPLVPKRDLRGDFLALKIIRNSTFSKTIVLHAIRIIDVYFFLLAQVNGLHREWNDASPNTAAVAAFAFFAAVDPAVLLLDLICAFHSQISNSICLSYSLLLEMESYCSALFHIIKSSDKSTHLAQIIFPYLHFVSIKANLIIWSV